MVKLVLDHKHTEHKYGTSMGGICNKAKTSKNLSRWICSSGQWEAFHNKKEESLMIALFFHSFLWPTADNK